MRMHKAQLRGGRPECPAGSGTPCFCLLLFPGHAKRLEHCGSLSPSPGWGPRCVLTANRGACSSTCGERRVTAWWPEKQGPGPLLPCWGAGVGAGPGEEARSPHLREPPLCRDRTCTAALKGRGRSQPILQIEKLSLRAMTHPVRAHAHKGHPLCRGYACASLTRHRTRRLGENRRKAVLGGHGVSENMSVGGARWVSQATGTERSRPKRHLGRGGHLDSEWGWEGARGVWG